MPESDSARDESPGADGSVPCAANLEMLASPCVGPVVAAATAVRYG